MSEGPKSASTTTAGSTCLLLVGDRVVLRATAPPDAEYALFEIAEIELRASEPGRVREHGYQTTAAHARARLANLGITSAVARDFAEAMHPVLSDAYSRGNAVRRVARYLEPLELFQADAYDGTSRTYRGVFLDLAALARDLDMENAAATIQALYLATSLEAEPDETTILLSTDACTKGGKPGARTYKRPAFAEVPRLLNALGGLSHRAPTPQIEQVLPRADVIAFLRTRGDGAQDDDARALYKSLESSVSLRDKPVRGPLASSDLWAIETRIESGQFDGTTEAIDEAERRHGRTPGTTYLRARVSLAMHLEPPKLIAERISALALSMTSFQELALLAAESWLDAGEPRRAMPYARDLVDAPGVDEGLLLRAQRLLARAVGAAPHKKHETLTDSMTAAPLPSRPPLFRDDFASTASDIASALTATESERPLDSSSISRPPRDASSGFPRSGMPGRSRPPPSQTPRAGSAFPPAPELDAPLRGKLSGLPSLAPPGDENDDDGMELELEVTSPDRKLPPTEPPPISEPFGTVDRTPSVSPPVRRHSSLEAPPRPAIVPPIDLEVPIVDAAASFTLDLPGPELSPAERPPTPESARPSRRPRISGVMMETRPPSSYDPRAEPDSPIVPRESQPFSNREPSTGPTQRFRSSPAPARSVRPRTSETPQVAPRTPAPPPKAASLPPKAASLPPPSLPPASRSFMHGASLPPYRHEDPAPVLTKAPLLPKLNAVADELAEHLALPPGIGGEQRSLDILPTSVLEARVQFTLLARELGLDYRLKRGIDLRADLSGIEAMQSVLLESFPDRVAKTVDEAYELRRHGALLSEILARRLEAEWLDISPNELGYWVMIVPPDTRVWPFGRVARLVAMGHKERDLVSYFLELQTRARGR